MNGKLYSLTALYKDDIVVDTCDNSFLNFLTYVSQSSRIKNVFIRFQVFHILLYTYGLGQECAKCDQIAALNKLLLTL